MSYYSEPDGPTPEQEAAWDYEDLRRYTYKLQGLIEEMVEIGDPLMDVADAVSFYDAWCKAATALLPKPSAKIEPYQPTPYIERDDGEPF